MSDLLFDLWVRLFVRGKEVGREEVRIGLSGCRSAGREASAACRSAPMSSTSRAVCDTPTVHFCCRKFVRAVLGGQRTSGSEKGDGIVDKLYV